MISVESCATESKGQVQDWNEVIIQLGSLVGVSQTQDVTVEGECKCGGCQFSRTGRGWMAELDRALFALYVSGMEMFDEGGLGSSARFT